MQSCIVIMFYSNYKNQSYRMPFDSGVSIGQMLDSAQKEKIDVLFVTSHDTLNGYNEILDYQQNHRKYYNIKIYPAGKLQHDHTDHLGVPINHPFQMPGHHTKVVQCWRDNRT